MATVIVEIFGFTQNIQR